MASNPGDWQQDIAKINETQTSHDQNYRRQSSARHHHLMFSNEMDSSLQDRVNRFAQGDDPREITNVQQQSEIPGQYWVIPSQENQDITDIGSATNTSFDFSSNTLETFTYPNQETAFRQFQQQDINPLLQQGQQNFDMSNLRGGQTTGESVTSFYYANPQEVSSDQVAGTSMSSSLGDFRLGPELEDRSQELFQAR